MYEEKQRLSVRPIKNCYSGLLTGQAIERYTDSNAWFQDLCRPARPSDASEIKPRFHKVPYLWRSAPISLHQCLLNGNFVHKKAPLSIQDQGASRESIYMHITLVMVFTGYILLDTSENHKSPTDSIAHRAYGRDWQVCA